MVRVIPGTRFVISSIALAAVVAAIAGAKEEKRFQAGPAGQYAHQTSDQVTVGAKSYDSEDLTAQAFGKKTDLLKYGVLPVLVVIENKRSQALDLRDLEINLVGSDGRHVSAVNPEDIPFLNAHGKQPNVSPLPVRLPRKKNPLNSPEIVTRAFSAKMLPPGDSANGFFYFEARPEPGDRIYLSGLRDARSGAEIMYFEFPMAEK
jgi:hypothetical protein